MEFIKENLMDKYPIEKIEILKKESSINSVDEFILSIKNKIEEHPIAKFIADFDNFAHTSNLSGLIKEDILAAKIIIFCFGKSIDNELLVAARPRNLGIVETEEKWIISFLEAPNEQLNEVIKKWVLEEIIKNE